MDYYSVPNWLRIILLVLTVLSFVPQICRTVVRKQSSGISTYYILFNLISATEQFALAFFFVVNNFEEPDFFVHSPVNAGDSINLVQAIVFTLLWLAFFSLCLYLPSDRRDGSVIFAIGAYIAFLTISIAPIFADAIAHGSDQDRRWPMSLFSGIHSLFLSWIITGLNVAAIFFQVKESRSRSSKQALSRPGLAFQAVVFMLLAVSWIGRVKFPYEEFGGFPWQGLSSWYQLVGWAAVDTAIFAIGQAILLYIVSRNTDEEREVTNGESEPLLRA